MSTLEELNISASEKLALAYNELDPDKLLGDLRIDRVDDFKTRVEIVKGSSVFEPVKYEFHDGGLYRTLEEAFESIDYVYYANIAYNCLKAWIASSGIREEIAFWRGRREPEIIIQSKHDSEYVTIGYSHTMRHIFGGF